MSHHPRTTTSASHGLLVLFVGLFLGFGSLLTCIAIVWGLHWVVACP